MTGGTIALEARGLSKRFGALQVTQDVSLTLEAGARTALIGPNGAGKTTLVNLLTGVLRADAGRLHLLGEDLTEASSASRTRKGLVRTFQISSLFAQLSVFENVFIAVAQAAGRGFSLWKPAARESQLLDRAEALILHLNLQAGHASEGRRDRLRAATTGGNRDRAGPGAEGPAAGRASGRHPEHGARPAPRGDGRAARGDRRADDRA